MFLGTLCAHQSLVVSSRTMYAAGVLANWKTLTATHYLAMCPKDYPSRTIPTPPAACWQSWTITTTMTVQQTSTGPAKRLRACSDQGARSNGSPIKDFHKRIILTFQVLQNTLINFWAGFFQEVCHGLKYKINTV